MPIILNHQLQEQLTYDTAAFPISFFRDELAELPDFTGPLHWHPDFEIAAAVNSRLEFQVGNQHVFLEPGDSIFINGNMLHGIRQLSGEVPDPMPIIVFSGTVIAPETSAICRKYLHPIADCDELPFIVFRQEPDWQREVNGLTKEIFCRMQVQGQCYEMAVQQRLIRIFELIFLHFEELPKWQTSRIQINAQIRLQKMLSYIYDHYAESITLEDIARAADISRSEAGRCFQNYLGCSPVETLIQHRLQTARGLLRDTALTLQEIAERCGFHSVSYFSRQFRRLYGIAPGQNRSLGKSCIK